jgi:ribosomal protein L11 methyltransferase
MTDFAELICRVNPLDPWRDLLIAQLADAGWEGFEETTNGFKAWISVESFDEMLMQQALELETHGEIVKLNHELTTIGSKNWNREWESNFQPVWVADTCYIRAPFHPVRPEAIWQITIEPKMSFGTGHHETTSLAVEWLLETDLKGKSVLDMGCGTGVLAILAAMKGAWPVTAIDNFLYAWENTRENAERNAYPDIEVLLGDASLLGKQQYDVIIANITRNVLIQDMGAYKRALKSAGCVILSGFLEGDKQHVIQAAKQMGLNLDGEKFRNGWVALRMLAG